jgi:hypothetical protein
MGEGVTLSPATITIAAIASSRMLRMIFASRRMVRSLLRVSRSGRIEDVNP